MLHVTSLSIVEVREVFDLFDFWDGRDGLVDGAKVGDFLRCCGLNPTNAIVLAHGGTKHLGKYSNTSLIYRTLFFQSLLQL